MVLLVVGALALLGFAGYYLFRALFVGAGVSLVVRLALPAMLLGLAVLVAAVVRDRLRDGRREHFEGVEH